jgi:NADH dehydrogenase
MDKQSTITVFGGSGFLGKALLKVLLQKQYTVRVASRFCQKIAGFEEEIVAKRLEFANCDIKYQEAIDSVIGNSECVINLVGILFEKKKGDFYKIHTEGAKNIALAAKKKGVSKHIHISALGIDQAKTSSYAKTKLDGEIEVLKAFPEAIIIRPSIMFGEGDNFFNKFARMAKCSPILPLIGGGATKFQPVYVQDVANAIATILEGQYEGKIFELTGPEVYSFKELLEFILLTLNKKRILLPIPFMLAALIGKIGEIIPTPPLTADQVELLKYDNISTGAYLGFNELGIFPKNIAEIVPYYLMKR